MPTATSNGNEDPSRVSNSFLGDSNLREQQQQRQFKAVVE